MRLPALIAAVALCAGTVEAQNLPHDLRQDTPPVPGQNVETVQDQLRIVPKPQRIRPEPTPGLPSSGFKGVIPEGAIQESRNDWRYAPPTDR
ncbi:MAG TPA: hypothetical protein VFF87_06630 [Hyphomicrobium sp.]|nr:hypothetical protein [Hyphomicrobium sp.]